MEEDMAYFKALHKHMPMSEKYHDKIQSGSAFTGPKFESVNSRTRRRITDNFFTEALSNICPHYFIYQSIQEET
jgi:hypothetical protein